MVGDSGPIDANKFFSIVPAGVDLRGETLKPIKQAPEQEAATVVMEKAQNLEVHSKESREVAEVSADKAAPKEEEPKSMALSARLGRWFSKKTSGISKALKSLNAKVFGVKGKDGKRTGGIKNKFLRGLVKGLVTITAAPFRYAQKVFNLVKSVVFFVLDPLADLAQNAFRSKGERTWDGFKKSAKLIGAIANAAVNSKTYVKLGAGLMGVAAGTALYSNPAAPFMAALGAVVLGAAMLYRSIAVARGKASESMNKEGVWENLKDDLKLAANTAVVAFAGAAMVGGLLAVSEDLADGFEEVGLKKKPSGNDEGGIGANSSSSSSSDTGTASGASGGETSFIDSTGDAAGDVDTEAASQGDKESGVGTFFRSLSGFFDVLTPSSISEGVSSGTAAVATGIKRTMSESKLVKSAGEKARGLKRSVTHSDFRKGLGLGKKKEVKAEYALDMDFSIGPPNPSTSKDDSQGSIGPSNPPASSKDDS